MAHETAKVATWSPRIAKTVACLAGHFEYSMEQQIGPRLVSVIVHSDQIFIARERVVRETYAKSHGPCWAFSTLGSRCSRPIRDSSSSLSGALFSLFPFLFPLLVVSLAPSDALVVAAHAVDAPARLREHELVDLVVAHLAPEAVRVVRMRPIGLDDRFVDDRQLAQVAAVRAARADRQPVGEQEEIRARRHLVVALSALEAVDMEERLPGEPVVEVSMEWCTRYGRRR